jgi:DNA-binding MarR family transcriptional regulator
MTWLGALRAPAPVPIDLTWPFAAMLANALSLSPNTVTELPTRAEEAGLVRREPSDEDLRVVYLTVTAEGERRLLGAIAESDLHRQELRTAFDALTATFRSASTATRSRYT